MMSLCPGATRLTRHGHRVRLEDLHSSNGTYVRLRGERELQSGDVLRVGDQVPAV